MATGRPRPLRAKQPTNDALRAHVTRVGFDLSLGRSHVASLVWLREMERAGNRYIRADDAEFAYRRAFANFATGMQRCLTRGLIWHNPPVRGDGRQRRPLKEGMRNIYGFTRAGELVIELLEEAGLYAEYAAALPGAEEAS